MKLFHQERTSRFESVLNEIYDVAKVLNEQGESDGKSRYMKIMAETLLFIDDSLRVIRLVLCFGLGVLTALLLR